MEKDVEFSGIEAIRNAVDELKKIPTTDFHHALHNCTDEKLHDVLGMVKVVDDPIGHLYGFRIYQRRYVPLNEVWLCGENGEVLKKFAL